MEEAHDREMWLHTSTALAMLANVNRNPKKSRAMRPADFNPYWKGDGRSGYGIPVRADNIAVLKCLL